MIKIFLLLLIFTSPVLSKSMQRHATLKKMTSSDRKMNVEASGGKGFIEKSKQVSGEYCKVWYVDIINDTVQLDEAYAQKVLEIADNSIAYYKKLGFDLPPNDYSTSAEMGLSYEAGGDDLIDIYLVNTEPKYFGVANQDGALKSSNKYGNDIAPSYILLEDDYFLKHKILDTLNITIAHELFHVIQNGYVMFDTKYYYTQMHLLMEMSSMVMEEMLYDHVNDYINSVGSYFAMNQLAPFCSDLIYGNDVDAYYGSSIWLIYFTDKYGVKSLVDIWEEVAKGTSPLAAFEIYLLGEESSFTSFWADFVEQTLMLPSGKSAIRDARFLPNYSIADVINSTVDVNSVNYSTTLFYGEAGYFYDAPPTPWYSQQSSKRGDTYFTFYPYSTGIIQSDSIRVFANENEVTLRAMGDMALYPNPMSYEQLDKIKIKNNIFKACDMRVYNMKGETVYQTVVKGSSFSLPKSLPSGVYILSLGAETEKIVYLRFVVLK